MTAEQTMNTQLIMTSLHHVKSNGMANNYFMAGCTTIIVVVKVYCLLEGSSDCRFQFSCARTTVHAKVFNQQP